MNTLRFFVVAGCLFFGLVAARANQINGVINLQGETVHLEFTGQQNWDYDVKRLDVKGQVVFEMTVPPMNDSSIQNLSAFKSDFITDVKVDRKGPDGKSVLQFTLAGEEVDTFDYLTDQPSRLIVDFYLNPSTKSARRENKAAEKVKPLPAKKLANVAKEGLKSKTSKNRKPATADTITLADQGTLVAQNEGPVKFGIFDGGDPEYDRFAVKDYEIKEDAIIRAQDEYYLPFPMLETPISFWEKMKVAPAIYEISPKSTDENKQARLLLTVFEKKRFAVYLKTQNWFKEKYPNSEYNEIVDFMTADVHLSQWQEDGRHAGYDEALRLYKDAVAKYPQSPLAERSSLKVGFLALEKGDYINSLRLFQEHIANKNFPNKNSLSKDLARLGKGLAFMKLNRWDDAISQFDAVEKSTANHDLKVDAGYRRGDVWARAKKYSKAVEEYQKALKKYPEGQSSYPNAFFNQAESLFQANDYRPSLEGYRDFVKRFPTNTHSAFAMTRMGELLDIFGVDKSRVVGAYLETYFRYGETPNAVVARLRLLSARMKGMKSKEVKHAVGEIMSLANRSELPNIEQFATVMVADGYTRRDEFSKSVDLLSKYYKEHPTSVDVPLLTTRIIANINDKLNSEIEKKDFISALKTHRKYSDNWLKNSKRLDTKYNVGRAFELAGVPAEAERYYKEVLNRLYAIRGTPEAREVQVKERVPSDDEMNLRLASILLDEQKFGQSYEHLKNIKKPEQMAEASQIERVNLAVKLLERRGDTDSAIRYLGELLKTWKGQPELVAEPYFKFAELNLKIGKQDVALEALQMIDRLQADSKKVSAPLHARSLEMMGEVHLGNSQSDLAAADFQKLLDTYEEERPLSSIRYKLGQIYFEKGEIQKAAKVWNEFKGEKSGFWKNLAQEKLKDSEWRDGYSKYIKRIPAMSENEQGN